MKNQLIIFLIMFVSNCDNAFFAWTNFVEKRRWMMIWKSSKKSIRFFERHCKREILRLIRHRRCRIAFLIFRFFINKKCRFMLNKNEIWIMTLKYDTWKNEYANNFVYDCIECWNCKMQRCDRNERFKINVIVKKTRSMNEQSNEILFEHWKCEKNTFVEWTIKRNDLCDNLMFMMYVKKTRTLNERWNECSHSSILTLKMWKKHNRWMNNQTSDCINS